MNVIVKIIGTILAGGLIIVAIISLIKGLFF